MRIAKGAGVLLLLALCAGSLAQAAVWDETIDGNPGVIGGEWWYNGVGLVSEDLGGGNWALKMTAYGTRGQIQRTRWADPPQGVTLYARFKTLMATDSQALRLQIADGNTGRVQFSWQDGTWSLVTGTGNSWSMPVDTWTTIWMTLEPAAQAYKLWVLDGSQWALASQGNGTASSGGVDLRFGSNSTAALAETWLDFWYIHRTGVFEPGDPNAPVPEPGSLLVMASALAGMGFTLSRKRG